MAITTGGGIVYDQSQQLLDQAKTFAASLQNMAQIREEKKKNALSLMSSSMNMYKDMAALAGIPLQMFGSTPQGAQLLGQAMEAYSVGTGRRFSGNDAAQLTNQMVEFMSDHENWTQATIDEYLVTRGTFGKTTAGTTPETKPTGGDGTITTAPQYEVSETPAPTEFKGGPPPPPPQAPPTTTPSAQPTTQAVPRTYPTPNPNLNVDVLPGARPVSTPVRPPAPYAPVSGPFPTPSPGAQPVPTPSPSPSPISQPVTQPQPVVQPTTQPGVNYQVNPDITQVPEQLVEIGGVRYRLVPETQPQAAPQTIGSMGRDPDSLLYKNYQAPPPPPQTPPVPPQQPPQSQAPSVEPVGVQPTVAPQPAPEAQPIYTQPAPHPTTPVSMTPELDAITKKTEPTATPTTPGKVAPQQVVDTIFRMQSEVVKQIRDYSKKNGFGDTRNLTDEDVLKWSMKPGVVGGRSTVLEDMIIKSAPQGTPPGTLMQTVQKFKSDAAIGMVGIAQTMSKYGKFIIPAGLAAAGAMMALSGNLGPLQQAIQTFGTMMPSAEGDQDYTQFEQQLLGSSGGRYAQAPIRSDVSRVTGGGMSDYAKKEIMRTLGVGTIEEAEAQVPGLFADYNNMISTGMDEMTVLDAIKDQYKTYTASDSAGGLVASKPRQETAEKIIKTTEIVKVAEKEAPATTTIPQKPAEATKQKLEEAPTLDAYLYGKTNITYTGPKVSDDEAVGAFERVRDSIGAPTRSYQEASEDFRAAQIAGNWINTVWNKMSVKDRAAMIDAAEERLKKVNPSVAYYRYDPEFSKIRALEMQAVAESLSANATVQTQSMKNALDLWKSSTEAVTDFVKTTITAAKEKKLTVKDYWKENPEALNEYNRLAKQLKIISENAGISTFINSYEFKTGQGVFAKFFGLQDLEATPLGEGGTTTTTTTTSSGLTPEEEKYWQSKKY